MLTDLLALALAGAAIRFATLPPTGKRTFGYYRLEILSAMANGILLTGLAVGIVIEAWHRFAAPAPVRVGILLPVAAAGLAANLLAVRWLHQAHGGLTTRAALWHAAADGASSALVLIAAVVMAFTSWWWVDSVTSLLLAAIVVYGAYRLLRESVEVLLESVPHDVDLEAVREALLAVDGVYDVHDLHIWSLTSQVHALSTHVMVRPDQLAHTDRILGEARRLLEERFLITHTTLQVETKRRGQAPCSLGPEEPASDPR
jgi:cobalt-zinc-cadmium efflux system protein